jgi:hypothetical protein
MSVTTGSDSDLLPGIEGGPSDADISIPSYLYIDPTTGKVSARFTGNLLLVEGSGTTSVPLSSLIEWQDSTNTTQEQVYGTFDSVTVHHEIVLQTIVGNQTYIFRDDGIFFTANANSVGTLIASTLPTTRNGSWMDRTGLLLVVAPVSTTVLEYAVTNDTNPRFSIDNTGLHSWGPGSGASDTSLARTAVGVLGLTGGLNASGVVASDLSLRTPTTFSNAIGSAAGFGVFAGGFMRVQTATGTPSFIFSSQPSDTVDRLVILQTGFQFGPGGSTARDTIVGRTGAGLFLLSTGVGIGYGTGTGGTAGGLAFGAAATVSKATGTLVYTSGTIVAGATSSTTLTNTTVAITDVVVVTVSVSGTVGSPVSATARITAANTVIITIVNNSAGTITASTTNLTVAFAVIKTATS